MKKKNLKSLRLKKHKIANINSKTKQVIQGGDFLRTVFTICCDDYGTTTGSTTNNDTFDAPCEHTNQCGTSNCPTFNVCNNGLG